VTGVVKVWAATAAIETIHAARTVWRFITRRHITGTDDCRISENGSVSHRWACQFGDDCPATDDPRVKAANARARPLREDTDQ